MSKSLFKKSKKQRLKLAKQFEALRKKNREFPYEVTVRLGCGCCENTMKFRSKQSFLEKWQAMPLTCSGEMCDDTDKRVTSIDTFYGYVEGTSNTRSLDYLLEQVTRKNQTQ